MLTKKSTPIPHSLEEREAAYLAARERIFSVDLGEEKEPVKQKPRSVPVVARRMIAHALGQRINPCNNNATQKDFGGSGGQTDLSNIHVKDKTELKLSVKGFQETLNLSGKSTSNDCTGVSLQSDCKAPEKQSEKVSTSVVSGRDRNDIDHKKEHLGAAKRLFANALGMPAGLSKSSESKH